MTPKSFKFLELHLKAHGAVQACSEIQDKIIDLCNTGVIPVAAYDALFETYNSVRRQAREDEDKYLELYITAMKEKIQNVVRN